MIHRVYKSVAVAAIFVVLFIFTGVSRVAAAVQILPAKIVIPTAKVNASIIKVGITDEGNLDVPPNYKQAGWYKYGALPGQYGNAVIDGHVDNGGAISGPFKNLKKIKVGDEITVVMNDKSKVIFTVTDASVFHTKAFPAKSVFHGDGSQAVLKLITCYGNFVKKEGTYDHRLIVTAVRKIDPSIATNL